VKIGGRLLRDQNSFGGPEHRPQQPWEILPVRGCGAEYFPLARSLSGTPEGVAAALRREYPSKSSLDDLHAQIRDILTNEKVNQQFFAWLDEQRKGTKIQFLEASLR